MKVRLINFTTNPLETVDEFAATSHMTDVEKFKKVGKLFDGCTKAGHTSVLESVYFVFHIEEVSRALLAQLTRHRLAGYCVESQRYVDQSKFNYVSPKTITDDPEANHLYALHMASTREVYKALIKLDISKEDARMVLPQASCCTLNCVINLRELINASHLRMCNSAQWEIRELFNAFKKIIYTVIDIPLYGDDRISRYLVPQCESHPDCPFCTEMKPCGKHPTLKEVYKVYLEHKDDKED